ncbi:hypothetical protein WOLCODRAFT_77786, partial [Wolfiporia cocos MD-104 SS10]
LAYRGIREIRIGSYTRRARTADNMIRAIDNIEVFFGEIPAESHIWRGLRYQDIRREIRYFLWMALHDGYMVGRTGTDPATRKSCKAGASAVSAGSPDTRPHTVRCAALGPVGEEERTVAQAVFGCRPQLCQSPFPDNGWET